MHRAGTEAGDGHDGRVDSPGEFVSGEEVEQLGGAVGELGAEAVVVAEPFESLGIEAAGEAVGFAGGEDQPGRSGLL